MGKKAGAPRERRKLSPAELAAAAEFKRLLVLATKEKSQDAIAQEIGVTQGAVWQWADGLIPISAKRARAAAVAVGADPSTISVAFRELSQPAKPATQARTSQPARLDPATLAAAIKLARLSVAMTTDDGDPFDPEDETDSAIVAQAFAYLMAREQRAVTADNVVEFARFMRQAKA